MERMQDESITTIMFKGDICYIMYHCTTQWNNLHKNTRQSNEELCSICCQPIIDSGVKHQNTQPLYMLSCSCFKDLVNP